MFSGLNKFIKNLLPKQLFYRALLIVAIPVIILQLTNFCKIISLVEIFLKSYSIHKT